MRKFILTVKEADEPLGNGPLNDCIMSSIAADQRMFGIFSKMMILKTPGNNFQAVSGAIATLDQWFKYLGINKIRLQFMNFDSEFFKTTINCIIKMDHHQLINKILTLLYYHSSLYETELRREIYGNYLLDEKFQELFTHWDEGVRNTYQQIILYKITRNKKTKIVQSDKATIMSLKTQALEDSIDFALLKKRDDNLAKMEKLVNSGTASGYDNDFVDSQQIYAKKSLAEYEVYAQRYQQWELSDQEYPKLIPLSMIRGTKNAKVDAS